MTCRECEKQIPDFIGRKMDYPKMKRFTEHVDTCESCREELVIQFLVRERGIPLICSGSCGNGWRRPTGRSEPMRELCGRVPYLRC